MARSSAPSVGIRVPANRCASQLPASSCRTSDRLKDPTGSVARPGNTRATFVVLANVVSCTTISRPSEVRCTSNSTRSAPAEAAARMAGSVFSGAAPLSPRCAITKARPGGIPAVARSAYAATGVRCMTARALGPLTSVAVPISTTIPALATRRGLMLRSPP
jgi:hypothetical protein